MGTTISPLSIVTPPPVIGTALQALVEVPAPAVVEPEAPERNDPATGAVALTPMAMAALLQAQENMSEDGPGARTRSLQDIDQLLARMSQPAPPAPRLSPLASMNGGFAVQMLLATRQELVHSFS